jgi:DNA-binding LytR/AlgR family response regulator
MSEILKHLPENFIRIHKSFIVDIARISYLSGNTLYLEDNTILTVGSTYKKELHAVINRRLIKSSRS